MKHPFDDFLPPVMHEEREDKRVIRIGIVLVAVVSIATAAAFATTLSGWRGLLQNRGSVAMRWDDATTRVQALVRAQKMMQDSIEVATQLEHFVDGVPRSLLLWELTQLLPSQSILNDIRLETRTRMTEDQLEEIEEWNSGTKILSERLSNEPLQWQKQLISFHAFDMVEENEVEVVSYDSQREQFMSAADYAAENLSLQSVMSGRTMLANINGSIYRVGDTISLRGGEIVMRIIEIGSAHAVVQLADNDQDGDTKRTIHIASTLRLVKKEQLR